MIKRYQIDGSETEIRKNLKSLINRRADEEQKISDAMNGETDAGKIEELKTALAAVRDDAAKLLEALEELDKPAPDDNGGADDQRAFLAGALGAGTIEHRNENGSQSGENAAAAKKEYRTVGSWTDNNTERNNKSMDNTEIRAFQKYVTHGMRNMNEQETRALTLSSAGAVVPTEIYDRAITDKKYSDLLHMATIISENGGTGRKIIPILDGITAHFHEELTAGTETEHDFDKLELGAYEIMGLFGMSAAAQSMSESSFTNLMLQLLQAAVIEKIEKTFFDGTGIGQPLGLNNRSWTENVNCMYTKALDSNSDAAYHVDAAYISEALALLPQQYARNAVIIMSQRTASVISRFAWRDSSTEIYNISTGLEKIWGKPVIISEHCPDENETCYICDPSQLFVYFSQPVRVEADTSAGFTSNTVWLRATATYDSAFNPRACVRLQRRPASSTSTDESA